MPVRTLVATPDPNRRQPGRPLKIDTPCREVPIRDEEGNPTGVMRTLTVGESVCADIASGMTYNAATKRAGITMEAFYDWTRRGRALRTHPPLDPRTRRTRRLDAKERRLVQFSVDLDQAEAEGEGRYFGAQATAALRPSTTTKRVTVVETDAEGAVTRRETEEVVTKPPSESAQRFILERRYKASGWAPRVEATDGDGAPLIPGDVIAAGVLAKLRAIQAGEPIPELPPGPIDAEAEEMSRARDTDE